MRRVQSSWVVGLALFEDNQRQFEDQVARYARMREFTLRLEDERNQQKANEFAREIELQEKKLSFTRKLIEARSH